MPSFSPKGDKSSSAEKTNGDEKGSFNGTEPGSHPVTILGRQLKPGLLPMVPELAKQTRPDMMNAVVAPIAQVKHEPQVNKPVIRHSFYSFVQNLMEEQKVLLVHLLFKSSAVPQVLTCQQRSYGASSYKCEPIRFY